MKVRKGFKYRLELIGFQRKLMCTFSGHHRAVWLSKDRLEWTVPIIWYHELNWNMSNFWNKFEEMNGLNAAPSQCCQQTLKQFDRAMLDCFDKNQANKRVPRFKKKNIKKSFTFPQGMSLENDRIKPPKLDRVKCRKSCELKGKLKSATMTRNGKYGYVSLVLY
ncbi:MAG: hypothetical protein Q9M15_02420 [Mariprofundaceae bacterium]|nr:hypothetical protein [Mariprofundaceae bacterium]